MRFKGINQFRANKIFTDRIEPTKKLNGEVKILIEDAQYRKIIVFYGIGGIGKTRFLTEAKPKYIEEKQIKFVHTSLDAYEYDNPVSILLNIRKKIKGPNFSLFDYAVVQYYLKLGLPFKYITDKYEGMDSHFLKFVKGISTFGLEMAIPQFSVLKNMFEKMMPVKDIIHFKRHQEEYQLIERLSTQEIYANLSKYLIGSINDAEGKVILFFDDYESMLNKIKDASICDNCEKWIIDLFKRANSILIVISAREKLNWDMYQEVITENMEQYYLEKLTSKDVRNYLEAVPINEDNMIEDIIKLSDGVPLYLDMCVDLYSDSISNGKIFDFSDLETHEITERYLRHLNDDERECVRCLVFFDFFDHDLVVFLNEKRRISLSSLKLKNLLSKSVFVASSGDNLKVDASVKQHILDCEKSILKYEITDILFDYLNNQLSIDSDLFVDYFNQLCFMLASEDKFERGYIPSFVQIINRLVDRGRWHEITTAIGQLFNKSEEPNRSIFNYFKILKTKRQGHILEAKQLIEQGLVDEQQFYLVTDAYRLLKIQVMHLLGFYDEALSGYKDLVDDIELLGDLQQDKRTYHLAKLKYADILFLKGKFKTALSVLQELSKDEHIEHENRMEILRVKAHIYRFNLDTKRANMIYERIIKESQTDIKIIGNVFNNLTETNCLNAPNVSLDYFEKSWEVNEQLGTKIELGKSLAAKSFALSKLGQNSAAKVAALESIELQTETGYLSGELFGKIALLYHFSKCDTEKLQAHAKDIRSLINKLTVYGFLNLMVDRIMNEACDYSHDYEWFDYDKTILEMNKSL